MVEKATRRQRLLLCKYRPLMSLKHPVAASRVPPWYWGEASTAALAQMLSKAILGWMGSMVMIARPGQLTQGCLLAFYFPCHLALYRTITQIMKKKKEEEEMTTSYF